jgi:Zn-dependent M32 family carboxypeptidase
MSRQLKKETVENLANHYGKLQAAVIDIRQNVAENEKSVKDGTAATQEGMKQFSDRMHKVFSCQRVAAESARYLGNVFGVFLSEIGEKNPEVLIGVFSSVKSELPNIVDAINTTKEEVRESAKERKSQEILAAAKELLARQQKKEGK